MDSLRAVKVSSRSGSHAAFQGNSHAPMTVDAGSGVDVFTAFVDIAADTKEGTNLEKLILLLDVTLFPRAPDGPPCLLHSSATFPGQEPPRAPDVRAVLPAVSRKAAPDWFAQPAAVAADW